MDQDEVAGGPVHSGAEMSVPHVPPPPVRTPRPQANCKVRPGTFCRPVQRLRRPVSTRPSSRPWFPGLLEKLGSPVLLMRDEAKFLAFIGAFCYAWLEVPRAVLGPSPGPLELS